MERAELRALKPKSATSPLLCWLLAVHRHSDAVELEPKSLGLWFGAQQGALLVLGENQGEDKAAAARPGPVVVAPGGSASPHEPTPYHFPLSRQMPPDPKCWG